MLILVFKVAMTPYCDVSYCEIKFVLKRRLKATVYLYKIIKLLKKTEESVKDLLLRS